MERPRKRSTPFILFDIAHGRHSAWNAGRACCIFLKTGVTPKAVAPGYASTVEACETYNADGDMGSFARLKAFGNCVVQLHNA